MMEATDMSKSTKMAPKRTAAAASPAAAPAKRGPGRPRVLSPEQSEKVMYRSPEAEYDELVKVAAEKGYLHRGEGTAGPLLLKIALLYLTSPNIRQVVDASRAVPPPPRRGKAATLEYRNFLRCTLKEREAIEEEALRQGSIRDGKGNPGPFIRKLITRYLYDASVRLAVDAALKQQSPAGGAS
jgi:hypothetical protein